MIMKRRSRIIDTTLEDYENKKQESTVMTSLGDLSMSSGKPLRVVAPPEILRTLKASKIIDDDDEEDFKRKGGTLTEQEIRGIKKAKKMIARMK